MRILVVDDEKIKRITLADDLSAEGHEVVSAADGEDAWTQLQTAQFDVVVTDLKMPRLDGIDLLKRIKQGRMADMAVIMMTAYGSIPVAVEAMRLGALASEGRRTCPVVGPEADSIRSNCTLVRTLGASP